MLSTLQSLRREGACRGGRESALLVFARRGGGPCLPPRTGRPVCQAAARRRARLLLRSLSSRRLWPYWKALILRGVIQELWELISDLVPRRL